MKSVGHTYEVRFPDFITRNRKTLRWSSDRGIPVSSGCRIKEKKELLSINECYRRLTIHLQQEENWKDTEKLKSCYISPHHSLSSLNLSLRPLWRLVHTSMSPSRRSAKGKEDIFDVIEHTRCEVYGISTIRLITIYLRCSKLRLYPSIDYTAWHSPFIIVAFITAAALTALYPTTHTIVGKKHIIDCRGLHVVFEWTGSCRFKK